MRFMCGIFVALTVLLAGCATYQTKVDKARNLIETNPDQAAVELKPLADTEGKDQLVYALDYALALQLSGQFEESSKYFIYADKLAELKDYTSITKEAGSLLFSEELVQYKGDDYEKLFINVFAAINFLMLDDLEGAAVETRRLTNKLKYFKTEHKKIYAQNPFAIYLNAHIWEASRNWDSAFIDFERAFNLGVNNQYIKQDLLRSSQRAGRMTKYRNYKKQFAIKEDTAWKNRNHGELVLIYQQGWGPRKRPRPESPRFPMLSPVYNTTSGALMKVQGLGEYPTELVCDVESIAIKTLDDQMGPLIAKRLAGIVAKETVARQVSKENEGLGFLMQVAMHASDRADLRQWSTLPQTLQVARVYLPAGEHMVNIQGLTREGGPTGEATEGLKVNIKPRKKTFVMWRSYR